MNEASKIGISEGFTLKRRSDAGGTPALNSWGCPNEYDVLTDVLLGKPDHLRHLSTSSLTCGTRRATSPWPRRSTRTSSPPTSSSG